MEFAVRNWPPEGEPLDLDHEAFAYGGKFNTGRTGKIVARENGAVVGAVAANEDRTDSDTLRFRYVSVREDRRGEGIGARLLRFAAERAREHGYERVQIAVNNPYAYEACYRAGFAFTGEETGMAELLMTFGGKRDSDRYRDGLELLSERDLPSDQAAFVASRDTVPDVVEP